MKSDSETRKRNLFFGLSVHAPWPEQYPQGRVLHEEDRHVTLAFLGPADPQTLLDEIPNLPYPSFNYGPLGTFDKPLFLPHRKPGAVAWHADWWEGGHEICSFQEEVSATLLSRNLFTRPPRKEWLPHLTVCRPHFKVHDWKKSFTPLPFYTTGYHLYQSQGGLKYRPIWSHPFSSPFIKLEHTADLAFVVMGLSVQQLYRHAALALAFEFPVILPYINIEEPVTDLDSIVKALNSTVTEVDIAVGSPLKAVGYHGEVREEGNQLSWEMIIDV